MDIAKRTVLYQLPGMEAVEVRRDLAVPAGEAGSFAMDLYSPPGSTGGEPPPAVIIVAGYPDPGFERIVGCRFKEMGSTVSWARLIAASGMAAIAYANREPAADLRALLAHLRGNAAALGIDERRIGLWASSGNAPLALSLLLREGGEEVRCAALCYPYLLDLDGATSVAETASRFGFVNPCAGKTVEDLRPDVPLFVARAGRDEMPQLNATLDRFLAHALPLNLPITLVNHPRGPHAFELLDDGATTREVVGQLLAFLRCHLLG